MWFARLATFALWKNLKWFHPSFNQCIYTLLKCIVRLSFPNCCKYFRFALCTASRFNSFCGVASGNFRSLSCFGCNLLILTDCVKLLKVLRINLLVPRFLKQLIEWISFWIQLNLCTFLCDANAQMLLRFWFVSRVLMANACGNLRKFTLIYVYRHANEYHLLMIWSLFNLLYRCRVCWFRIKFTPIPNLTLMHVLDMSLWGWKLVFLIFKTCIIILLMSAFISELLNAKFVCFIIVIDGWWGVLVAFRQFYFKSIFS